ncbi:unnamed protein product [Urochloa humidicola]
MKSALSGELSKPCLERWKNQIAPIMYKFKTNLQDFVKVTVAEILDHIGSNIRKGFEAQMAETYYLLFMISILLAVLVAIDMLEEVVVKEEDNDPDDPDGDVGKKTLKMGYIVLQLSKQLLRQLWGLRTILEALTGNREVVQKVEKALLMVAALDTKIQELEMEVDDLKKRMASGEDNAKQLDAAIQAIQTEITKHAKEVTGVLKEIEEILGSLKKH